MARSSANAPSICSIAPSAQLAAPAASTSSGAKSGWSVGLATASRAARRAACRSRRRTRRSRRTRRDASSPSLGAAGQRDFLDRARQEVERPAPAVALVAHEALRQTERVRRAVGIDADQLAEQRRGVGEAALGEIAGHLALGMDARQHPPDDLQHELVADDEGAVRLLRRQPPDLGVGRAVPDSSRSDVGRNRISLSPSGSGRHGRSRKPSIVARAARRARRRP